MPGPYGVGGYGLGLYSAASVENFSATLDVDVVENPADWNRARDGKGTYNVAVVTQPAHAEPLKNAGITAYVVVTTSALPTYVRSMVGHATLQVTVNVIARAQADVNFSSTLDVGDVQMTMLPFGGKFWNPEDIEKETWVPETVSAGIWVIEPDPQNPWG